MFRHIIHATSLINQPESLPVSATKQLPHLRIKLPLKLFTFGNALLTPIVRAILIVIPIPELQDLQRCVFASIGGSVRFEKVMPIAEDLTSELLRLTEPANVAIQIELLEVRAVGEKREGGEIHRLVCTATVPPFSHGDVAELQTVRRPDGCEEGVQTHGVGEHDVLLVEIAHAFGAHLFTDGKEVGR